MFLDSKQAEERLSSEKNLALRFTKDKEASQAEEISQVSNKVPEIIPEIVETKSELEHKTISLPGKNKTNLTKSKRTEIATRARLGESQTQIAREMNISQASVSYIESGKTKGIDEEKVAEAINEVKDIALSRLMASLGFLTNDKLSACSAKDLSTIASNMGRVVEKVTPKEDKPDNINFIIYSPELKQERAFEVVEI